MIAVDLTQKVVKFKKEAMKKEVSSFTVCFSFFEPKVFPDLFTRTLQSKWPIKFFAMLSDDMQSTFNPGHLLENYIVPSGGRNIVQASQ